MARRHRDFAVLHFRRFSTEARKPKWGFIRPAYEATHNKFRKKANHVRPNFRANYPWARFVLRNDAIHRVAFLCGKNASRPDILHGYSVGKRMDFHFSTRPRRTLALLFMVYSARAINRARTLIEVENRMIVAGEVHAS